MEMAFGLLFALISWIAAAFVFMHIVKEKLGAPSDLAGIGMANVLTGFLWHEILERKIIEAVHWEGEIPKITWILSVLFLVLGLAGIIMIAMDILRTINKPGRG